MAHQCLFQLKPADGSTGPHRTLVQLCSHVLRFELIYLPARPRVKHAGVIIHRPICLLFGASCRPLSLSLCLSLSLSRSLSPSLSLSLALALYSALEFLLAMVEPLPKRARFSMEADVEVELEGGLLQVHSHVLMAASEVFRSNVAIRHAGSSVWAHCAQGKASG